MMIAGSDDRAQMQKPQSSRLSKAGQLDSKGNPALNKMQVAGTGLGEWSSGASTSSPLARRHGKNPPWPSVLDYPACQKGL